MSCRQKSETKTKKKKKQKGEVKTGEKKYIRNKCESHKVPIQFGKQKGRNIGEDDLNRNNVKESVIFSKHQVIMHEVYLLFVINFSLHWLL